MRILRIVPEGKKGSSEFFSIVYLENHKEFSSVMTERKIIRKFSIDKMEFKRVLMESLSEISS